MSGEYQVRRLEGIGAGARRVYREQPTAPVYVSVQVAVASGFRLGTSKGRESGAFGNVWGCEMV